MLFERLLAKSVRTGFKPAPAQTIRKHTMEVIRAADRLVTVTGRVQLSALGLDPVAWLERFRHEVMLAALLHDLGKANDHFQDMVQGLPRRVQPQGLRHEAVSFLIARLPEIQAWVRPALAGSHAVELVLWAVAGHHRKFPPDPVPGSGASMRVFLEHDDFRATLALGARDLGLGPAPEFTAGHPLATLDLTDLGGLYTEFQAARRHAAAVMTSLPEEERRFVAALKACLICADVAGSIGFRGTEAMVDWIPRAFGRVPTPEQLLGIVQTRLKGGRLRPFQEEVASRTGQVALALAGCGTGKTLAAYLRAARQAPGRRVFFCYPTTGTATEGYRDYLGDPALEADLIHGRSDVDKAIFKDLLRSEVGADIEPPTLGDDEPDREEVAGPKGRPGGAAEDSAGALEQWSTPLVSCTVDTVLGLVQNNRRGLYAWPSIAGSYCVFDEVHAYDEKLFAALLRFLADLPGIPCLLMTASLPADRLHRLRAVMEQRGEPLDPIPGPPDFEAVPRYRREPCDSAEEAWNWVRRAHVLGCKILWVVNTVDTAISLAVDPRADELGAELYHSRFRYRDRVVRHRAVIDAFDREKTPGPAFAICTQVAEMSLDLSADLLITHLAPIPSLIQRLGRLNRKAKANGSSGLRPFLVYEPPGDPPRAALPYTPDELNAARSWLDALGFAAISQSDLVHHWPVEPGPESSPVAEHHIWLDGGFVTEPWPLRESSPGIDVILEADRLDVEQGRVRPEEVRVPMPPVPRSLRWQDWPVTGFCRVPPGDLISYDPKKGARWTPR